MKTTLSREGSVLALYITPEHPNEEDFVEDFFKGEDEVSVQYSEDPYGPGRHLSFSKAY